MLIFTLKLVIMTLIQHHRFFIYLGFIFLCNACGTKQEKELAILEYIYKYKENSDLTNLKWYLMYKVDRSMLNEPTNTIVLLERKLMGLDREVPFISTYQCLNIMVKGIKIAKEERQVAAADVFTSYLAYDDHILKSPLLAAHVATILYEPFDLIKANVSFLSDYKHAALGISLPSNKFIKNYYKLFAELMDATEHQQGDKYEYAKVRSSASLSQLIRDGHQTNMQNLCGHLTRTILLNKFNAYDTIHVTNYFDYYSRLRVNEHLRNIYCSMLCTTKMVENRLNQREIEAFDPNENCAMHSFSKIYFYTYLRNSLKTKYYIDNTLSLTEDTGCSYFRSLANKELINYLYTNNQKEAALLMLSTSNIMQDCPPMIKRIDLKIQYSIMAMQLYMDMCHKGYKDYCIRADSAAIELEKSVEVNEKEMLHFSNQASGLGIDRLKLYIESQHQGRNSLPKLLGIFQKSKARQLVLNAQISENNCVSKDTLALLKKMTTEMASVENDISLLASDKIYASVLHHRIFDLQIQKLALEFAIEGKTKLAKKVNINPADLQQLLKKENAIFLDFISNQDDLFKLTISSDTFYLTHISLTSSLKDSIQMYKSLVKDPASNLNRFGTLSRLMTSALSMEVDRNTTSNIIISPSDLMYDFPFESLMDKEGRYLIENQSLQYVYNISMLKARTKIKNTSLMLFAYSDQTTSASNSTGLPELYFAKKEVEAIAKIYPYATLNTGLSCNRTRITNALSSDIVHFSTHAVSDPTNRHNNYIVLRDGLNEDRFYGYDFEKCQIKADLIVLNGCETQLGQGFAGEGEFSLTRSLKNSGVANVISTRWKINDQSSAELMKHFYTNLSQSTSYNQSLRSAQLKLITSSQFKHPYYWAGYAIY